MRNRSAKAQIGKRTLSPENQGTSTTEIVARSEYYEGLTPHPDILARGEALQPGYTRWIMDRVQSQQDHRIKIESMFVGEKTQAAKRGQWMAFFLGAGCLVVAAYAIHEHQEVAGLGSVLIGIGSIVAAYISGTKRESEERIRKDQILHGKTPQTK